MPSRNLKLIINCGGSCEAFITKCLESVRSQSLTNWHAYVTIDACQDNTFDRAVRYLKDLRDLRFDLVRNPDRRYSLRNQIDAIGRSGTDPEDVIVSLDGDDWFATPDALSIIDAAYEDPDCWMTYGSWFSSPGGAAGTGLWPAYPPGTTDFRHAPWLATAVRTWKRWLFRLVRDRDLRDDAGQYFRIAEDRAIMLPMLEMSGTARARHIATPLMEYNQRACYDGVMVEEASANVALLAGRRSYVRL